MAVSALSKPEQYLYAELYKYMVVKNSNLIVYNIYRISYEYILYVLDSVSFRLDATLPGNGYNTGSFINLIKSVKLCLKVNLRILATRLVGACLTFLNICLLFYCR